MNTLLILPTQLYSKKYIPSEINKLVLWEHPFYFKRYKFNKKKLILHRASMKSYYDLMKKNYSIEYIEFNKKCNLKSYSIFDPIDKIKLKGKKNVLESPNFLLSNELLEKYRKKTKIFFFHNFYMWSKKELDIIPKIKSQDKLNRQVLKDNIKIPKLPKVSSKKYINEAIKYIEKNFKKNYGNTKNFNYPIDHKNATKFMNSFIKKKI